LTTGIVAAIAGAALLTATAVAATALKDPKALVLQKADLPATAVRGPSYAASPSTFGNREYWVAFNLRAGSREEVLTSDVAVSRQAKDAARGYKLMLVTYTGLPGGTPLTLPAYGNAQRAEYRADTGRATLVVRENAAVWRLVVESCSSLSPAGCLGGRTPPKLTKAQAVSELQKYARKQRARIGSG
jgi:hypothetical protein